MNPGDVIGNRFEIERVAGVGGMGIVYRAFDRVAQGPVALKVVRDANDSSRFAREARVLSGLKHPRIVRYVDHGTTDGKQAYLAMEWLDGEDLAARLGRSGLTVAESIELAVNVAEALGAAHAQGIVHRDVKPSNILLLGEGVDRLKLLDFGIARITDVNLTRTSTLVGTPGYMAPELARGELEVDARADTFALGCVLFECLTGAPAFSGENVMAVLAKILLDSPPRARSLQAAIPPELDDLVARMMSKQRDRRPNTLAEVAKELAALGKVGPSQRVPRSHAPPAITTDEQHVFSVVLASTGVADVTAATMGTEESGARIQAVRAAMKAYGAHAEPMLDGSIVVALTGAQAATDQASWVAKCALALRPILPGVPMAIATARGSAMGRAPLGQVIERAARLLRAGSNAPGAAILLDEVTHGLLDARFEVSAGDPRELLGERAAAEAARTLLGKPTPCVGRDREMASLIAMFDECAADRTPRAVLVTAPAGVGKSRLRYEVLSRLAERDDPPTVWFARGDPMSNGSPFGMLAQLVRGAAGAFEGEPLAARQDMLRARVARHVDAAEVARTTQFLAELIGAPFPDDETNLQLQAARRDHALMGDQIRRAWEDLLGAEAKSAPVILVLEDLHWGDAPTVRAIDSVLRNLQERPIMVLALARPDVLETFPGLWAERALEEVRLSRLTPRAAGTLVRQVLGDVSERTAALLVERAGGNAFFLEELIRAAHDRGAEALPETVLAMVQARLDGLDPMARRVMRAGSVFGGAFWRRGVITLVGGARHADDVGAALSDLLAAEVITRRTGSKFVTEDEFAFRHALVREAAYAMLTDGDRALGHKLAGEWLETTGERDAIVLAEHFERGDAPAKAAVSYRRAAEQALEGNDFEAAITRAGRGLECGASGAARGELHLLQAQGHSWRGRPLDAETCGLQAMAALPPGGVAWYRAAAEVADAAGCLGQKERLAHAVATIEAAPCDADATSARIVALSVGVRQFIVSGGYEQADLLLALLGREEKGATVDPASAAQIQRAFAVRALVDGDPARYRVLIERAAASSERAGDLRGAAVRQSDCAYASIELGLYREAEAQLRDVLAVARRLGLDERVLWLQQNLGQVLIAQGALAEARVLEQHAIDGFAKQGNPRMEAASRVYFARILARTGELDEAERQAERAMAIVSELPLEVAFAQIEIAAVRLLKGDARVALDAARAANDELVRAGGIDEGEARIRLIYAEALHATGDLDEARAAITTARDRLHARAAKIGDEAWRQSFLECVPENARTLELARAWSA